MYVWTMPTLLQPPCTFTGAPGNPMRQAARKGRTTTREDDIALAQAAADAELAAASTIPVDPTPDAAAEAQAADAEGAATAAAAAAATESMQGADPAAAAAAAAGTVVATKAAAACPNRQFEWPASTKYCWYTRDSGGNQQGPGSNVFKKSNVAVNTANQLVLTINNPNNT